MNVKIQKKTGRPRTIKFNVTQVEAIVADSQTNIEAANRLGISRNSFNIYKNNNPDFQSAYLRGLSQRKNNKGAKLKPKYRIVSLALTAEEYRSIENQATRQNTTAQNLLKKRILETPLRKTTQRQITRAHFNALKDFLLLARQGRIQYERAYDGFLALLNPPRLGFNTDAVSDELWDFIWGEITPDDWLSGFKFEIID